MINKSETNDGADLVKTGRDGRVRYSAEQKQRVLELFESSGMSGKAFAEKHGIKYPTFALWRRQKRDSEENSGSATENGGGFVLAEIGGSGEGGCLSMLLPGGVEVKARDEAGVELLAGLIRKLS